MPQIDTKRLIIRSFTTDDWKDFQELSVDWKAAPGPEFDKWETSEEASKKSVEHMATKDSYFAVCVRATGKVIGLLSSNGIEAGQLELGHVILSKYQDNDHDREALRAIIQHYFDQGPAQSVLTHNAPHHTAQLAPLKSLGFANKNPKDAGELVITKENWLKQSLPVS